MVVSFVSAPRGNISLKRPSSDVIVPPLGPISLLVSLPLGVPKPVESDGVLKLTESFCEYAFTKKHRRKRINNFLIDKKRKIIESFK